MSEQKMIIDEMGLSEACFADLAAQVKAAEQYAMWQRDVYTAQLRQKT